MKKGINQTLHKDLSPNAFQPFFGSLVWTPFSKNTGRLRISNRLFSRQKALEISNILIVDEINNPEMHGVIEILLFRFVSG